jgi:hypothetical protein
MRSHLCVVQAVLAGLPDYGHGVAGTRADPTLEDGWVWLIGRRAFYRILRSAQCQQYCMAFLVLGLPVLLSVFYR